MTSAFYFFALFYHLYLNSRILILSHTSYFTFLQVLRRNAISHRQFETLISISRKLFHLSYCQHYYKDKYRWALHSTGVCDESAKNGGKQINKFNCPKYIKINNPRAFLIVIIFRCLISANVYYDSKLRISFDKDITVWLRAKELDLCHSNKINPDPPAVTKEVNISSRFSHYCPSPFEL